MLKYIAKYTPPSILNWFQHYILRDYYRTLSFVITVDPAVFHTIADKKVVSIFQHAAAVVPAYRDFLKKKKIDPSDIKTADQFNRLVPHTNKKNYVQKFEIEDRCTYGELPLRGNIDESAGTSSMPTSWIRSIKENDLLLDVAKFEGEYLYEIDQKNIIVLSAWSCGPWATGIKFCQLMQQHALVKNCGPNIPNIVQALKTFGKKYQYVIAGYPPFLKSFVDEAKLPLKKYRLHFLTGGEGVSVQWKNHLKKKLQKGTTITSSYGASDVDIGIGFETPFCHFIRELCSKNKELQHALFGNIPTLPMFFQYNPMMHYITQTYNREAGKYEFVVTLLDEHVASPKIRYNLHDEGGVYEHNELLQILKRFVPQYYDNYMKKYADWPILHLPFLYVAGRTDGTISLDGANVYPEQIEAGILANKSLQKKTQAFMMYKETTKGHDHKFTIAIHLKKGIKKGKKLQKQYCLAILKKLKQLNGDFVESYRAHKKLCTPKIVLCSHDYSLFVGNEDSVKVKYIR